MEGQFFFQCTAQLFTDFAPAACACWHAAPVKRWPRPSARHRDVRAALNAACPPAPPRFHPHRHTPQHQRHRQHQQLLQEASWRRVIQTPNQLSCRAHPCGAA